MLEYYFVIASLMLALLSCTYYLLNSYLILKFKGNSHKNKKPKVKSNLKEVTILVTVYNENIATFKDCINRIKGQKCKFIVVGDSSNEPYRSITIANGGKFILCKERGGQRKAISTGMKYVNTKYVMIVDSDILIPKHTVKSMLSKFEDDVGGVGATVSIILENNWISYCSEFFQKAKQAITKAMASSGTVFLISGGCGLFRTDVVKPFLLSDEFSNNTLFGKKNAIAEDQHVTNHIINSGYRAVMDYDVDVLTKAQDNFKLFFYQTVRWVRGGYLFFFKEVLDGSYIKKGALYSFETFYIYLLPIALIIMGLLRIGITLSNNLLSLLNGGISGIANIIFLNYQSLGIVAYVPFVTLAISLIGTTIFLVALSGTLSKKKLKTIALGGITSVLIFCASIYALLTIWDQEKWYTR
jgi:cellulose synthase/poly-beta-1,6-N-acetylglucosamine synthase-like glycosyltransferase